MKTHINNDIIIKGILAAIFLTFTGISWFISLRISEYSSVSLRYHTPLTQEQVDRARRNAVTLGLDLFPTFWSESKVVCESSLSSAAGLVINVLGESRLVATCPILKGDYPTVAMSNACAVSEGLAMALWGSSDILGLKVLVGGSEFRVCGLFAEQEQVLVAGTDLAIYNDLRTWQAVEILGISSAAQGEELALTMGLGAPDSCIDNSVVGFCSSLFALLPLMVCILCFAHYKIKILFRLIPKWRWAVIFALLLVLAILFPLGLELLPDAILPTRWSDFDFWSRLAKTAFDDIKEFLMRYPLYTDGKIKLLLLSQVVVGFAQVWVLITFTAKKSYRDV